MGHMSVAGHVVSGTHICYGTGCKLDMAVTGQVVSGT